MKGANRTKYLSPEVGGPAGRMGMPISEERADGSGSAAIIIYSDRARLDLGIPEGGARVLFRLVIEFASRIQGASNSTSRSGL